MKITEFYEDIELDVIKEHYKVIELLEERLWCAQVMGEGRDHLHFFDFQSSNLNGSCELVSSFFRIEGFSETLREGRHTYFPEEGYVFYLNMKMMIAALNHCTKYFDMD